MTSAVCEASTHSDTLDDLEQRTSYHDENEERKQPRTDWVFVFAGFRGLGYVATLGDVLGGLIVGDLHSLGPGHFSEIIGPKMLGATCAKTRRRLVTVVM